MLYMVSQRQAANFRDAVPSGVFRLAGSVTKASCSTNFAPESVSKMIVASTMAESVTRSVSPDSVGWDTWPCSIL